METILQVTQVLVAISMIAIILVQRGAGAAAGSGFGAGASATVFGSQGSGSFLTRTTAVLALLFFGISLTMAVMAGRTTIDQDVDDLGVMAGVADQPIEVSDVPQLPTMESTDAGDVPVIQTESAESGAQGEAQDESRVDSEPDSDSGSDPDSGG